MEQNNAFTCIIVITLQIVVGYCQQDKHSKFPDIFYMDNFYECVKNKDNAYCTANMNLIPKNHKSKLWKEIEDWSIPGYHYNHTIIHRTLCVPDADGYRDYLGKTNFFEYKTNEELKGYNLSAEVFSLDCKQDEYFGTDTNNVIIGLLIYISFVLLATIHDERGDKRNRNSTVNKLLTCFSLTSNLEKLTSDKNPDYQKLKCIQGIRTFQALIIVGNHVVMVAAQLYIKNPSYMEETALNPIIRIYFVLSMFLLQTYFMMSSWLLTNQILEIHKKKGRFSLRDGLVLLLHRVARFSAPLLAMMFLDLNLYVTFANGPGNFETANILSRACSKNWWATLFQVANFLHISQICNIVTWSLSIDTQFYMITIVFLYVALNYHLEIKKCLAYLLIFTYAVNMVIFYRTGFPVLLWIDPKFQKRIDFYHNEVAPVTYYGFWINSGSSLIGILFGYFYFVRKGVTKVEALERLCGPTFIIVPIAVLLVGAFGSYKFVSVLGPLLKPLYAFGIACGIYGMSRNAIQGWHRLICENKLAVWLGSFTFSIYIHHFLIVSARGARNTSLVEISAVGLAVTAAIDIVRSLVVGIICALVIEQPGINIKKMVLPQIWDKNEPSKDECNGYKRENKIK